MSKTELPYLKTWLPEAGDNDPTVRQKLETLARTAEEKRAAIMGKKLPAANPAGAGGEDLQSARDLINKYLQVQ